MEIGKVIEVIEVKPEEIPMGIPVQEPNPQQQPVPA